MCLYVHWQQPADLCVLVRFCTSCAHSLLPSSGPESWQVTLYAVCLRMELNFASSFLAMEFIMYKACFCILILYPVTLLSLWIPIVSLFFKVLFIEKAGFSITLEVWSNCLCPPTKPGKIAISQGTGYYSGSEQTASRYLLLLRNINSKILGFAGQ